ncbi:MAG: hypothetical protein OXK82_06735 [Deltaproteobacteria bacterium]|nr:hypothetical protein [Deltaproteobacteria bacterium]
MTAANTAVKIAQAAVAQPTPGSVTQSSNVDSSNISIDQVDITAQYGSGGPSFSVRNGTAWSIGTNDGNPSRISGTPPPWQGVELGKRIAGGTLYVDAYTDIEAPSSRQVPGGGGQPVTVMAGDQVEYTGNTFVLGRGQSTSGELNGQPGTFTCAQTGCSVSFRGGFPNQGSPLPVNSVSGITFVPSGGSQTVSEPDSDYLAGGIWLIAPDDASSAADYAFGAFADGSDPFLQPNLAAVTGTAIYTGDATGVYSAKESGGITGGYLDADVRLTANFGDATGLGTINGSITNFALDGTPVTGTLSLGTANIGVQNSGFFRGVVTGADNQRSYTGHWGGQFFGNSQADGRPGSVAGTFGGHSTDDVVSFVGAFGAHKQ